ncbi:MAG: four helix bundle protein [Chitinophagaceae bacterium]|nr:four helix bundle protein [Chitinophagaceae bacterium]
MENKLEVWNLAHELATDFYKVTKSFPKEEIYGLVNQVRRSVVSIPANIVEGQARQYKKEFLQFLYISKGSAEETNYHLFLSKDLGYISGEEYNNLSNKCIRIKMMLNKLINSLKN